MSGIMMIIGIACVVGVYLLFNHYHEKERTRKLQEIAQQMGLRFDPEGNPSLINQLAAFHLFSQGRSKQIKNMLRGQIQQGEIAIFGYQYTTGSGKNTHTARQTVVSFRAASLNLPHFALRPENMFHKIGEVFGYRDIDFESHPTFSDRYLLRADDEAETRRVFTDQVLSHFEQQTACSTEGGGDQLIFYRADARVAPDQMHAFMEEGLQVLTLFEPSPNLPPAQPVAESHMP